jgi:hypothetical protein
MQEPGWGHRLVPGLEVWVGSILAAWAVQQGARAGLALMRSMPRAVMETQTALSNNSRVASRQLHLVSMQMSFQR